MTNIDEIEILFKENYAGMHRLATILLHDSAAAHDIVHDIFTSILTAPPDTAVDTAYLMTSVRNRSFNMLKAMEVRDRFRNLYLQESAETSFEDTPDGNEISLFEEFESDLPPECSEILKMRFSQGLTAKEIALAYGLGERAIYKQLKKALTILKHKLNG